MSLVKALIEREELLAMRIALLANVERVKLEIANKEMEVNELTSGKDVDTFCERFSTSNQISIADKIQDAQCKLMDL